MPSLIRVLAEREVAVRPERVFAFLADYRVARPRILTSNYLDYRVEEGGSGAGTVISYRFQAAGRERPYRLRAETPAHHTLLERDAASSLVTTWRVMPAPNERSIVRVVTEWQGGGGIGGLFERTFAPRGLRRVYDEVLQRLEAALSR
jgi:Polyketide cyclase / dehydrase and lipid transport